MDLDNPTLLRRLGYGLLLGIVIYVGYALIGDGAALASNLGQVPALVIVGACGLSALNYLIRFAKWHLYVRLLDLSVPPGHSLVVFLAGLSMSISPGKIGEVIKSALLKRSHGLSIARTAPMVFAERLTDLLGLFVIAAIGIVVFEYGIIAFSICLFAVLGLILFLQSPRLVHRLLDVIEKVPIIGERRLALDRAYRSTRQLLAWRPLATTTLLSGVGWSMEALAFGWLLLHLGADVPVLFEAFFVFSTSTLLGALSFLPGGLGLTEGSMTGLLLWLEVVDDLSVAAAATYLIRFTTLWFGVIVGFLFYLLYEWHQRIDGQRPSSPGSDASPDA